MLQVSSTLLCRVDALEAGTAPQGDSPPYAGDSVRAEGWWGRERSARATVVRVALVFEWIQNRYAEILEVADVACDDGE